MTVAIAEEVERPHRRSLAGYAVTPAVLLLVVAGLALYVSNRELDSIEERRLTLEFIIPATLQHITLTFVSTAIVLVLAVPVGILLTRPFARGVVAPAVAVFNVGQAVPSIGVLVLLAIVWGIGFWPAVVALVAYSALPVLRNTVVGLQQVDPSVIEAGRGMGMSRSGVLARIELPLAVPVVLTGLRTALVINVGTAALAALTNAGGLGTIIITGLVQNRPIVTVVGSVLTAVLALFIDYVGRVAEDVLRPKGL
ncbi:MAG TPA: ABC transporter permease [Pseudonocardia sp.]|jgi:osmoprotectant transport system permease protein|uniref:ABC transporter permease n=1 Tax=Pseudonocardia sp. TaxID=60912 RepID=UPI002B4B4DCD|nr:ABC transporter permease [Pseudonocardia sp.]HLU57723.1 ABC transporter permease [Pseudonocardia sp.]